MNTVHRAHGLRFTIFVQDHEPPHVHVVGDGDLEVQLSGPDGRPVLLRNRGMKTSDLCRAMHEIELKQAMLLESWRKIHD